jgi:hypothetical protein
MKCNFNYILHVGDGSPPAKHLNRWLAGYYVDVDVLFSDQWLYAERKGLP